MASGDFLLPGLVLDAQQHRIQSISWSQNGGSIAAGCVDGTLMIWNSSEGRLEWATCASDGDALVSVAWSPTDGSITTASAHGSIMLFDPATKKSRRILEQIPRPQHLYWSEDGQALAITTLNGAVCIWDPIKDELWSSPPRSVTHLAWSPDGKTLATACMDRVVRLWRRPATDLDEKLVGHSGPVFGVCWSRDGRWLATGSQDRTIRLWDCKAYRPKFVLEGHQSPVQRLSFSPDNRYLAGQGSDGTVRFWRCDTWEQVACKENVVKDTAERTQIAFNPSLNNKLAIATVSDNQGCIRIWFVNHTLSASSMTRTETVHYSNAKAVLVGDSSVGKTGLGLVLSGKPFKATESSHGRHVFVFEHREITRNEGSRETREILLWDLAGQPGYRMIHQLHLDEVSVALIVFDSRSEIDPFAGVRHWSRALRMAESLQPPGSPPMKRYLVAARADRGAVDVSKERIQNIIREFQFDGYFETSAKEGWQVQDLREAIRSAIDWDSLPRVSSTSLFLHLQRFLIDEKKRGRILSVEEDLFRAFVAQSSILTPPPDLRSHFSTCIGRLEAQGLIRRLSFGELVLLQPELLDTYASMLVNAAKDEPDGLGSIPEEVLLAGRFRMPNTERLHSRELEKLLLLATAEELLNREIALRETADDGTYYIFPSQFRRERPEFTDEAGKTVVFEFKGPVMNVYSTLAVRLSHCGFFTKDQMWQNAATYKANGSGRCGMLLRDIDEGHGELTLFADRGVGEDLKHLFEEYVDHHLTRRALPNTVRRRRILVCECGLVITDQLFRMRAEQGYDWLDCPICSLRLQFYANEHTSSCKHDQIIPEMDRRADARRDQEVTAVILEAKTETKEFDVFLAHKSKDKPIVSKLADQLRQRRLNPWLDKDQIPPGRWFQDVIQAAIPTVKSAAICIGPSGIGRWQSMELRAFVSECVEKGLPVIPVLLPGVTEIPPDLPFLRGLSYVQFRKTIKETAALELLEWGITGVHPKYESPVPATAQSAGSSD